LVERARQATSTVVDEGRTVSYDGTGKWGSKHANGSSIADQNFGVTAQSILHISHEGNMSMQNAKTANLFSQSGSFLNAN